MLEAKPAVIDLSTWKAEPGPIEVLKTHPDGEIRFRQLGFIMTGRSAVPTGLDYEGRVWRWDYMANAWARYPMTALEKEVEPYKASEGSA